jgi:hypothetical protein
MVEGGTEVALFALAGVFTLYIEVAGDGLVPLLGKTGGTTLANISSRS